MLGALFDRLVFNPLQRRADQLKQQNTRLSEHNARLSEQNARLTGQLDRMVLARMELDFVTCHCCGGGPEDCDGCSEPNNMAVIDDARCMGGCRAKGEWP